MKAKEYFNKLSEAHKNIEHMMHMADWYRTQMMSISGGSICVISSDPSSSHEPKNIKYLGLLDEEERKIDKAEEEYEKLKDAARALIMKINNPLHEQILVMRYLEFCSWSDIIDTTYISRAQIFRCHKEALTEFEEVLNKVK